MDFEELVDEILDELVKEIKPNDVNFNKSVLESKIRSAYRSVKNERKYPETYTQDMINKDMEKFYQNIYDIALYDYNMVGAEFQQSHGENGVNRTWSSRNSLFKGIVPIAQL